MPPPCAWKTGGTKRGRDFLNVKQEGNQQGQHRSWLLLSSRSFNLVLHLLDACKRANTV